MNQVWNLTQTLCVLLLSTLTAHAQVTAVVQAGNITISTNGVNTSGGGPVVPMVGIDIASSNGSLIPFDPPRAPVHSPFLFLLSNTETSIFMASVPAPAQVEDDAIEIGYTGFDGIDLTASYGVEFSGVSIPGIRIPVVTPEPRTGLSTVLAALGLFGVRRKRRIHKPETQSSVKR